MKRILISLALIAATCSAGAQEAMKVIKADELVWKDHPFFKGVKTAVLLGDPAKAETIIIRNKFPPNYRVAPHTHPYTEIITVISGMVGHGTGGKFDAQGEMFQPGTVFVLPPNHAHYVWTGNEPAIIQVQYMGPSGIDFINPADDPRNK
jgi:quercetin dioxygenase-like cupin family protein